MSVVLIYQFSSTLLQRCHWARWFSRLEQRSPASGRSGGSSKLIHHLAWFITSTSSQIARPHDFARPGKGPGYRKRPLLGPPAAESRRQDIFYQLGLDPLHECQNSTLMSWYVSGMGKIKTRAETGLTWKNQRRLGKAIRRAKMMGIIPVLSKRTLGLSSPKREQW